MTTHDDDSRLSTTIGASFDHDFNIFAQKVRELASGLSEEEFWTKPYPYGNSVGHLVLHLTGNLSYYIGTQIAQTGYVRNRDREFTDTDRRPKEDVLKALDETVAMVAQTVLAQSAQEWVLPYQATGVDVSTRFNVVLLCAEHFHHHIGQMIYLVKERERQRR